MTKKVWWNSNVTQASQTVWKGTVEPSPITLQECLRGWKYADEADHYRHPVITLDPESYKQVHAIAERDNIDIMAAYSKWLVGD